MIDLRQGDCLELMKDIPDKSIDMILCDLPYGTTRNKWDSVIPFEPLWEQYNRIIKDNGAIVLFACETFTSNLILSNIKNFKYRLTWKKDGYTNFLNAKRQPLRQIEDICVFYKEQPIYNPQFKEGKPYKQMSGIPKGNYDVKHCNKVETINDGKRYPSDLIEFGKVKKTIHPTQKPVELLEYLIKTYTNENELVLDNCMGSGSTGVACLNTNRNFIGIELDEKYFEIAKKRIEDVSNSKKRGGEMKFKVLELFGGIGACSKALERIGVDYGIADYVEIDKYAVKSFNAIHNTNFEPQDVCEWDKDIKVDLLMHGSPCQDFSLAGLQKSGDKGSGTRSSLMWETIRIVEKIKPKYVIWENVKNLLSKKHIHNFNAYLETMEQLGYTNYYQVLNAKDYGIPQNRERVFTISILGNKNYEFPKEKELEKIPLDFIEKNADKKYDLTEKNIEHYKRDFGSKGKELNLYEPIPTLTASMGTGGGNIPYFTFPPKQELKLKLKDMLEDEVDNKYYISDGVLNNIVSDNQAGYLSGGKWDKINESCRRYYKEDGISPTVHTCQGGNTEPKVLIKKDMPKVIGGIGEKKSNGGTQWYQQDRIYDNNIGLSISTTAQPYYPDKQLRIRKLTPKECWRLMGFDDKDFEAAEKVNSNNQLYKQAGNSIVVNVLEAILKNLLKGENE